MAVFNSTVNVFLDEEFIDFIEKELKAVKELMSSTEESSSCKPFINTRNVLLLQNLDFPDELETRNRCRSYGDSSVPKKLVYSSSSNVKQNSKKETTEETRSSHVRQELYNRAKQNENEMMRIVSKRSRWYSDSVTLSEHSYAISPKHSLKTPKKLKTKSCSNENISSVKKRKISSEAKTSSCNKATSSRNLSNWASSSSSWTTEKSFTEGSCRPSISGSENKFVLSPSSNSSSTSGMIRVSDQTSDTKPIDLSLPPSKKKKTVGLPYRRIPMSPCYRMSESNPFLHSTPKSILSPYETFIPPPYQIPINYIENTVSCDSSDSSDESIAVTRTQQVNQTREPYRVEVSYISDPEDAPENDKFSNLLACSSSSLNEIHKHLLTESATIRSSSSYLSNTSFYQSSIDLEEMIDYLPPVKTSMDNCSAFDFPETSIEEKQNSYFNIKSEFDFECKSESDVDSEVRCLCIKKMSESVVDNYFQLQECLVCQNHADQLPFRCDYCGRHFKHKRSRDRHIKLHTGDKKYKCTQCEAAFSRSDHLKIHLKTHDTQKPYRCTICTRGYSTAAALSAHMQNHKSKSTPPFAHLLKEVGDTTLISRLIRDSAQSNLKSKSEIIDAAKACSSSSPPMKAQIVGESVQLPICSPQSTSMSQIRHPQEDCERPTSTSNHSVSSSAEKSDVFQERPQSLSNHSTAFSYRAEVSPTNASPISRPASVVTSPRPTNFSSNPFLALVGGKLACPFCSIDGFPSFEAFQLHIQSVHGSSFNGDILGGLHSSLASYRSVALFPPLLSPLGSAGSSRQVSCELCGARVSGVTALQRHVVAAHSFTDLLARAAEGVFCAQCLLPFSNPGALTEHIKLVHSAPTLSLLGITPTPKRPSSPLTPTDLSKKSRHDNRESLPSSTFLCSQCNAPFADFESFRAHLKEHLDGVPNDNSNAHVCPECHAHVGSESALEVHLANHLESTSTEYGCHACLKSYAKPDELQKHLLDMHASHLYRCALCRHVFDSKVSIQVHFAVEHSNETEVYKCTKCSLKYRSRVEFESHVKEVHLRDKNLVLNGATLDQRPSKSNRTPSAPGGFRCLLCPSTLSTESEMTAHLATHERQFKCSLCDEAFHVEFLLDRHMEAQHAKEMNGSHDSHKSPISSPEDVRCGICDTHFTSEAALSIHRRQVHEAKPVSKIGSASLSLFCAYCSEVCKSRNDLEAHIKSSHVGVVNGRHKCNICDEIFPTTPLLAQHKVSHVKVLSNGAQCIICHELLTTASQVKVHQTEHHSKPLPQPCVICRQTLVTDIEVNVHAKYHSSQADNGADVEFPEPSQCLHCHLKMESASDLQNHICIDQDRYEAKDWKSESIGFSKRNSIKVEEHWNDISSGRTYQCIKCQESFASEAAIEAHVTSHLEQEGSSHLCHLCRTYFDTPLRLQCHLIEHTFEGYGSFTCYLCASVYTTASRLQQHMITHGLASKPYDCHHCTQSFFFRAELENHLPTHSEAANGCRDCQATFPTGIRGRAHGETVKMSCPSCSFEALSVGELRAHSAHHIQNVVHCAKPSPVKSESSETLECKTCSKKCRSVASLRLHSLTHEGGKPYLCSECGTAFTRRCEASKHSSQHKSNPPTKCQVCSHEFSTSEDGLKHLKKLHEGPDCEIVRPDSKCSSCDGESSGLEASSNIS